MSAASSTPISMFTGNSLVPAVPASIDLDDYVGKPFPELTPDTFVRGDVSARAALEITGWSGAVLGFYAMYPTNLSAVTAINKALKGVVIGRGYIADPLYPEEMRCLEIPTDVPGVMAKAELYPNMVPTSAASTVFAGMLLCCATHGPGEQYIKVPPAFPLGDKYMRLYGVTGNHIRGSTITGAPPADLRHCGTHDGDSPKDPRAVAAAEAAAQREEASAAQLRSDAALTGWSDALEAGECVYTAQALDEYVSPAAAGGGGAEAAAPPRSMNPRVAALLSRHAPRSYAVAAGAPSVQATPPPPPTPVMCDGPSSSGPPLPVLSAGGGGGGGAEGGAGGDVAWETVTSNAQRRISYARPRGQGFDAASPATQDKAVAEHAQRISLNSQRQAAVLANVGAAYVPLSPSPRLAAWRMCFETRDGAPLPHDITLSCASGYGAMDVSAPLHVLSLASIVTAIDALVLGMGAGYHPILSGQFITHSDSPRSSLPRILKRMLGDDASHSGVITELGVLGYSLICGVVRLRESTLWSAGAYAQIARYFASLACVANYTNGVADGCIGPFITTLVRYGRSTATNTGREMEAAFTALDECVNTTQMLSRWPEFVLVFGHMAVAAADSFAFIARGVRRLHGDEVPGGDVYAGDMSHLLNQLCVLRATGSDAQQESLELDEIYNLFTFFFSETGIAGQNARTATAAARALHTVQEMRGCGPFYSVEPQLAEDIITRVTATVAHQMAYRTAAKRGRGASVSSGGGGASRGGGGRGGQPGPSGGARR